MRELDYGMYREEMTEARANDREDLVCSFEQWLERQEKIAAFFDRITAEK